MSSTIPSTPKWHCVPSSGQQINTCAITPDGSLVVCGTWLESKQGSLGIYIINCYASSGDLLWSIPVSDHPIEHGVYWVAISDDGSTVAAGGQLSENQGFLKAYQYNPGPPNTMRLVPLLDITTPGRINQVSLSGDGTRLVACYGNTIVLFARTALNPFTQLDSHDASAGASVESVMINKTGTRAVLGAISWGANDSTSGQLISLDVGDTGFLTPYETSFNVGVMRVAITDDGSAWGGSLHDGSCVCYQGTASDTPTWRYQPENVVISYGIAIGGSDSTAVQVALGVNLPTSTGTDPSDANGGAIISLTSVKSDGGYKAQVNWRQETKYGVNPGISFDSSCNYITGTDGKPANKTHVEESAGHFYLFDNTSGTLTWSVPTIKMNWPMMIDGQGQAIVGGSDDGELFFWAAS
ncbi:MAG: hypothetical protein AAGJ52_06885 [Pseudomonadota bacterium]